MCLSSVRCLLLSVNVVATLTAAFEMISSSTGEELQQMHVHAFQQQHVLLAVARSSCSTAADAEKAAERISSRCSKQQMQ